MAETSSIEWTDATWNPITGCSVVSPGCTNCYAMKLAGARLKHHPSRAGLTRDSKAGPVWNGKLRLNEQWLPQPLRWARPRMIFVCAHGDLFHEDVPDDWIDRVFAVMALAPQHTFQVLTKRSARMRAYMLRRSASGHPAMLQTIAVARDLRLKHLPEIIMANWPLPNIWLGISAEDQARADERIPDLLATPATIRFLSAEPLLGPINVKDAIWAGSDTASANLSSTLDWVIVGGESGKDARPMHPDWARQLRDQCAAAGAPFFFKQWGEWLPDFETFAPQDLPDDDPEQSRFPTCVWDEAEQRFVRTNGAWDDPHHWIMADDYWEPEQTMTRYGKRWTGRYFEGVEHNGMPEVRHA